MSTALGFPPSPGRVATLSGNDCRAKNPARLHDLVQRAWLAKRWETLSAPTSDSVDDAHVDVPVPDWKDHVSVSIPEQLPCILRPRVLRALLGAGLISACTWSHVLQIACMASSAHLPAKQMWLAGWMQ